MGLTPQVLVLFAFFVMAFGATFYIIIDQVNNTPNNNYNEDSSISIT
jgi:hypothetical protein